MVAVMSAPTGSARAVPVEVRALSHRFMIRDKPLSVLEEVSFTVDPGQFVAVVGPSGCGKSTLLRLAAGLERPAQGTIWVDGRQVSGPDAARALVFQDPMLYPWRTVWRNVAVGLEARGMLRKDDPRVHEILDRVGLSSFANALPHQLSGGMAQRAALARALVNEPTLLLFDEPLGQLDALTRFVMQRELLRMWDSSGFTALLVTHDVDEALYLADRVLVLSARPGRVIGEVTVDVQRPRHHDDLRFQELRKQVLTLLGFDWT
jgi:NitT/TauT family transport system ATP-binding protein